VEEQQFTYQEPQLLQPDGKAGGDQPDLG